MTKGIILAAGKGTRLYPMTKPLCKPLLPVYDKPMIYYPLTTLVQAGISDILIIVPPSGEQSAFEKLLGDGSQFGIHISYAVQPVARGIADALLVGADFIGDDSVCLVLGDNLFYGAQFDDCLQEALSHTQGATVFGYYVEDPRPFGVVEIGADGKALSIEEKPAEPKSNYIIPGLYFYDNQVVQIAREVKPSARGELEITSVNNAYLEQGELRVVTLARDFSWYDTGTAESMFQAAEGIRYLIQEQGAQPGCLEEAAYRKGFLTREQLLASAEALKMTEYGQYLFSVAEGNE